MYAIPQKQRIFGILNVFNPMSTETKYTFCRICEALCGLEIGLENGRITRIQPDKQHVATNGFGCIKGLRQQEMYESPDRLKWPMKRSAKGFEAVNWEAALSDIGQKVRQIMRESGPDAIAMYVGTAAGFGVLHPIFAQGFMTGIGSKSMYASATQDCSNKFAVSRLMYGFPFTLPYPDIAHTQCLIVVGANPVISKWSFLQVPNPAKQLKAIEKRGGKLYFVDPRKTESAKVAGEHVFIRPNTDVFFYLSFLHELIQCGGVDAQRLPAFAEGWEAVAALAAAWPAEKTEAVTHIPAAKLREMVHAYQQAEGAALYCSTGVNMGSHGSLAYWLQEVINAVSGNLDRQGGTLVGKGIIDFPSFGHKNGVLMREDRSRIGNFGSVNDAFPGGILADEILTPGDKQIRALFVTGGNPLLTMANAGRLRQAFSQLELLVVLDILPGETAAMAHYMLPCTSPLQRPDLPFIFPLMLGLQSKPYLQATKAVIPPEAGQRDEASIYLDLCRYSGVPLFGSRMAQWMLQSMMWLNSLGKKGPARLPQTLLLNLLLKVCRQKSFGQLLKHPHGLLRPPNQPGSFLQKRILTESGKLQLAPLPLMEEAEKLPRSFERELQQKDELKLITRRAVTTHNSWTHNHPEFLKRGGSTNYLYMHPRDAHARGLEEGQLADVCTDTAQVRVPVKFHSELMPGTVALPHGWGHQHSLLSVAGRATGVNVNLLAADGPDQIEAVSGMAHLTGFVVKVSPAPGPLNTKSWSGV
ncbi:MAG: hypothetical protein D6730_19575 [Bacteroidetes bacterium]|nr:MAG: hypothetical protein D6730_19575 [Bacteroidota bacterium]